LKRGEVAYVIFLGLMVILVIFSRLILYTGELMLHVENVVHRSVGSNKASDQLFIALAARLKLPSFQDLFK